VTAPAAPRTGRLSRGRSDVALVVVGAGVLALASLPIEPDRVPAAETAVFRLLNDTTVLPFVLLWPVMQLGNLVAVPASALLAAFLRRWRLAAGLLIGGFTAYYLAKVVKGVVTRPRPTGLLTDVVIRGAEALGRGFVAGHAAVVVALTAIAWPWLGRRGRAVVAVLATVVCLARVYVGAHLPLDVVGGAGLGLAIAGVVRLATGRPG
jgi:membrane-associated phospholipid phosphatase